MPNKAWPLRNFLKEVSKWFKCYVYVKNFDQKPGISSKTLKIGFSTRYCDYKRFWGAAGGPKSFLYDC